MKDSETKLSYRFHDSVDYFEQEGLLILVLGYPLKMIKLNPVWKPVFNQLSQKSWISFNLIVSRVKNLPVEKVELFLQNLVCKGFIQRMGTPELRSFPMVSIIIPVKNRPNDIKNCIEALLALDYPSEKIEITVVDDGSTDNTIAVIEQYPVNVILLRKNRQAPFCRNLAAKKAKGKYLAFIDSDCIAGKSWLQELLPVFKNPSVGAVGGLVDSTFQEKKLDRYEKVKSSLNMGKQFRCSNKTDLTFYVPSCNLLVRKKAFQQVGGFKEHFIVGEDVDLCWRMQEAGFQIEYQPVGKVCHKHRNQIVSFCLRRFDYGTSEPVLQKEHTERKKMMIWGLRDTLFWIFLILSVVFQSKIILLITLAVVIVDVFLKKHQAHSHGLEMSLPRLFAVAFRGYVVFLYHIFAFLSRYYLIALPLVGFIAPIGFIILISAHLITGIVEFKLRRPNLNLFFFIFYFTLEQTSYQTGVWWACFKNGCFSAVFPKIRFSRPVV